MDVDREIEVLYGLPLEEFTAARNALARTVKDAGRPEDAAAVQKLKKPPVSAWAVNRLAREDPSSMKRLLELVERLKDAGSLQDIHELGSERRDLMAKMTRRAGKIMEAAGHAASPGTLQRVTRTLQAGGEEEERRLLLSGVLSEDLEPAGFDVFGEATAFSAAPPERTERADELEELRRIAAEAEEEAARLSQEAERAEAAAISASEAASEARRRARTARENAQRAARSAR